jgi:competence protein ComEA
MKYAVNFFRVVVVFFSMVVSTVAFSLPDGQHDATLPHKESTINHPLVNINTADTQTIINAHLKGIGKKRAEAIVAYRSQHGPFKSVDDLKNIKGISENVINTNREKLKLS